MQAKAAVALTDGDVQMIESFLGLLDYEIRSSARWRRYTSLLVIGSTDDNGTMDRIKRILKDDVRGCDELVCLEDGTLAVLMPETSKTGVQQAIGRYEKKYDGWLDVRIGAASFPQDAQKGSDLFEKACARLERAKQLEPRTVVSEE